MKWGWLLVLALVGGVGFLAQVITSVSVQSYDAISTETCTLVEWQGDNSKGNTVWADFKCGDKTITIKDGALLAKYMNKAPGQPLNCTFKVGAILGDKDIDCDI